MKNDRLYKMHESLVRYIPSLYISQLNSPELEFVSSKNRFMTEQYDLNLTNAE